MSERPSDNAGAPAANPTNPPAVTAGAPAAVASTAQVARRPGGLFTPTAAQVARAAGPIQRAGVPHAGVSYASALLAGVIREPPAVPVYKRDKQANGTFGAKSLPWQCNPGVKRAKPGIITQAGGSTPQAVSINAAHSSLHALTQAFDRDEQAAIGQPPPSTVAETGARMAGVIQAATAATLGSINPNASAQPAAPHPSTLAAAAGLTLSQPAVIAAAPAAASTSSQVDANMVAASTSQHGDDAAHNAMPHQFPPEGVAATIPPRSHPPAAVTAATPGNPPAPHPVAVLLQDNAGGTDTSATEVQLLRLRITQLQATEAELRRQHDRKDAQIEGLQLVLSYSGAARADAGAVGATPTALSSSSTSAASPAALAAAQQRVAELEAQLLQERQLMERVQQDWMLRAGFFPPGDPTAERKKKKLLLNMLKDTSSTPTAIAKAEKQLKTKQAQLASEEDALRLAAARAARFRIECEYAQMNFERKQKLAADQAQVETNYVDEQMRLLQEAEERKQRAAEAKANTQRLRTDSTSLQQRLAVDQYEGVRAMFGAHANNLLMPNACPSPAGAGAGVGHLAAASRSSPPRRRRHINDMLEDEAEEADEDEVSPPGSERGGRVSR